MGGALRLGWCCAFGVAIAPAAAHASAWPVPEQGQEIRTIVGGVSESSTFYESEIYFERPVNDRIDAVIVPRFENGAFAANDGSGEVLYSSRGEVSAAAKFTLHQGPNTALALQSGAVWTSAPAGECGALGGEARALAGASIGQVFTDVQLAYRASSGECRNGKVDFTAGWRPQERWMGLAQTFIDTGPERSPVVKLQMSVVRFNDQGAGLQIGVRVRADGEGDGERALVVSWWRAPHKSVMP